MEMECTINVRHCYQGLTYRLNYTFSCGFRHTKHLRKLLFNISSPLPGSPDHDGNQLRIQCRPDSDNTDILTLRRNKNYLWWFFICLAASKGSPGLRLWSGEVTFQSIVALRTTYFKCKQNKQYTYRGVSFVNI